MTEQGLSFNLDPSNTPVMIATLSLVLWLLSEQLLQLCGLHQPKSPQRERLSMRWIGLSYYGAVIFPFFDAVVFHWTTLGPSLSGVRYVGIPFLVAGICIRIVSRLNLGKQFSGHVQTTETHRLTTSGVYVWIRHPLYLGYICLQIGFPVCFGSVAGFACAIFAAIPAIFYRIRIEEVALAQWFGDEYRDYANKTHRLIPFLW